MESMPAKDIALRLLELEQRFESYCVLHEEELAELKASLLQLREELLALRREDLSTSGPDGDLIDVPENGSSQLQRSGTILEDLSL